MREVLRDGKRESNGGQCWFRKFVISTSSSSVNDVTYLCDHLNVGGGFPSAMHSKETVPYSTAVDNLSGPTLNILGGSGQEKGQERMLRMESFEYLLLVKSLLHLTSTCTDNVSELPTLFCPWQV